MGTGSPTTYGGGAQTGGEGQNSWGTAEATGTIEVALEWNPSLPGIQPAPPPYIAVRERCLAYWSNGTGSCANGFGDSPFNTSTGQISGSNALGPIDHWKLMLAGDNILVNTVDSAANVSTPFGVVGAAGVAYEMEWIPIRLLVDGLTDAKILVGQQLEAKLLVGPSGLSLPFENVTWEVIGTPKHFDSFVVPTSANYWRPSTITPTDLVEPTLRTHFLNEGNVTIRVMFELFGGAGQIERSFEVKGPESKTIELAGIGEYGIFETDNNGYAMGLLGAGGSSELGIVFNNFLLTPPAFTGEGYGQKFFVQTVNTVSRQKESNGNWWKLRLQNGYNDALRKIDLVYPYNSVTKLANGEELQAQDTPGMSLSPESDAPFAGPAYAATDVASFTLTLFYLPPGEGSMPVPVQCLDWSINGSCVRNANGTYSMLVDDQPVIGDPYSPADFFTWTYHALQDFAWYDED